MPIDAGNVQPRSSRPPAGKVRVPIRLSHLPPRRERPLAGNGAGRPNDRDAAQTSHHGRGPCATDVQPLAGEQEHTLGINLALAAASAPVGNEPGPGAYREAVRKIASENVLQRCYRITRGQPDCVAA